MGTNKTKKNKPLRLRKSTVNQLKGVGGGALINTPVNSLSNIVHGKSVADTKDCHGPSEKCFSNAPPP